MLATMASPTQRHQIVQFMGISHVVKRLVLTDMVDNKVSLRLAVLALVPITLNRLLAASNPRLPVAHRHPARVILGSIRLKAATRTKRALA